MLFHWLMMMLLLCLSLLRFCLKSGWCWGHRGWQRSQLWVWEGFEAESQTGDYDGTGFHPGGSLWLCWESESECLKFSQNSPPSSLERPVEISSSLQTDAAALWEILNQLSPNTCFSPGLVYTNKQSKEYKGSQQECLKHYLTEASQQPPEIGIDNIIIPFS